MIYFILFLIILNIYLIPFFVEKKKHLFSPMKILSIFKLFNTPYILYLVFNPDSLNKFSFIDDMYDARNLIVKLLFYEALAFTLLLIGYYSSIGRKVSEGLPTLVNRENKSILPFIYSFGLGLLAYTYFLQSIGGLNYLWDNLNQRTIITAGTGYTSSIYTALLTFSTCYLISLLKFYKGYVFKLILLFSFLVTIFILSSTGGRTPTIVFILTCIFCYHYTVKRIIKIPKIKLTFIAVMVVIFLTVVPMFRDSDISLKDISNTEILLSVMNENIVENFVLRLSTYERDLVVFSYFNYGNFWWGKSYIDLIYAPIPRTIFPEKPPVDDGVYIKAIADGQNVKPSMPASSLPLTSWPPSSVGILYANFGGIGIIVGMFLLGIIYNTIYHYMIQSNFGVNIIVIFTFILLKFSYTNLGIVNMLIISIINLIIAALLTKNKLQLKRVR